MQAPGYTESDVRQLERRGISRDQAAHQLSLLRTGVKCPKLLRPCVVGDGILTLEEGQAEEYVRKYRRAAARARVAKFVPASGAATRMIRALSWADGASGSLGREAVAKLAGEEAAYSRELMEFAEGLPRLACYADLQRVMQRDGLDLEALLGSGELKQVVGYLLGERGLGYATLPKALIKFHSYGEETRTALEEHLSEAAAYIRDQSGRCRLHFTVAPRHKSLVDSFLDRVRGAYEKRYDVQYEIDTSVQEPSTDTLAIDERGDIVRQADGSLLLRPGGHGALIGNLEQTRAEVVFIDNIDDVVHESVRALSCKYQMVLGGLLFELRRRVFFLLDRLAGGEAAQAVVEDAARLAAERLNRTLPEGFGRWDVARRAAAVRAMLDRPLRVCGVVANRGEAGGGPFWVEEAGGGESPQIVEGAQVDRDCEDQVAIFRSATHFNPVHIVAALAGHRGGKFALREFADPGQAFVAEKSQEGRRLKALEWPGLWNGGMAFWNTVFVEIPRAAFAPVKTICDLLKPPHQGSWPDPVSPSPPTLRSR